MQLNVKGEQVFSINAHSFGVSPSAEGYTLAYSVDGTNFTNYSEPTPANETLFVNSIPRLAKFKLVGNNSDVIVEY